MTEPAGFLLTVLRHALDPMLIVVAGLGGLSVNKWFWAALVGLVGGLLQILTIRKLLGVDMPLAQTLAAFCAGALLALSAQAVRRWLERRKGHG